MAAIWDTAVALARARPARVAIGFRPTVTRQPAAFLAEVARFAAEGFGTPVLVAPPGTQAPPGVELAASPEPERELGRMLKAGEVDGAVRGSLEAAETLLLLKRSFAVQSLCRIALLRTRDGRELFLAPVGVDEGATTPERLELVRRYAELASALGAQPRLSVLAEGREEDRQRVKGLDDRLRECAAVAAAARERMGIMDSRMDGVAIEDAVGDQPRLVLAPSGPSGNLVFRTLVFLGGGTGLGAPAAALPRPFVDVSRAKSDVLGPMVLASALAARGMRRG